MIAGTVKAPWSGKIGQRNNDLAEDRRSVEDNVLVHLRNSPSSIHIILWEWGTGRCKAPSLDILLSRPPDLIFWRQSNTTCYWRSWATPISALTNESNRRLSGRHWLRDITWIYTIISVIDCRKCMVPPDKTRQDHGIFLKLCTWVAKQSNGGKGVYGQTNW